jgi:hypothetical protein
MTYDHRTRAGVINYWRRKPAVVLEWRWRLGFTSNIVRPPPRSPVCRLRPCLGLRAGGRTCKPPRPRTRAPTARPAWAARAATSPSPGAGFRNHLRVLELLRAAGVSICRSQPHLCSGGRIGVRSARCGSHTPKRAGLSFLAPCKWQIVRWVRSAQQFAQIEH